MEPRFMQRKPVGGGLEGCTLGVIKAVKVDVVCAPTKRGVRPQSAPTKRGVRPQRSRMVPSRSKTACLRLGRIFMTHLQKSTGSRLFFRAAAVWHSRRSPNSW